MTNVTYTPSRVGRKQARRESGPSRTVKTSALVCCLSNMILGIGDQRLRYFLVYGKRVPINAQAFLDYCRKVGWPKPDIWKNFEFDVEGWVFDRAMELEKTPPEQAWDRLAAVVDFSHLVGLQVKLIKIVVAVKPAA